MSDLSFCDPCVLEIALCKQFTLLVLPQCFCSYTWQQRVARVRACNYVKFETGGNLPPVLKIVTHTAHAVHRHKTLLLSMWPMIYSQ